MRIAHIIPPPWTGLYPKGSYRMVLAHWVAGHPEYVKALRSPPPPLAGSDAYVFLDNGSFENHSVPEGGLNEAATAVGADEIILPDVIGDPLVTLKASWAALARLGTKRVMFVPQGSTVPEWESCLKAWLRKWESSTWATERALSIGITSLRHKGERKPIIGSRPPLIVAAAQTHYPFHILGVASPMAFGREELPAAVSCGARGVDTSLAFALAAERRVLTVAQEKVRLRDPSDYQALNTGQRRLVWLNMAILESWIEEGQGSNFISTWLIRSTAQRWEKYYAEGFCPLTKAMQSCGMTGRFALTRGEKQRGAATGREKYVRMLLPGEKPLESEEELRV